MNVAVILEQHKCVCGRRLYDLRPAPGMVVSIKCPKCGATDVNRVT